LRPGLNPGTEVFDDLNFVPERRVQFGKTSFHRSVVLQAAMMFKILISLVLVASASAAAKLPDRGADSRSTLVDQLMELSFKQLKKM
jgi:hypothetical protein